jgi:hypothetical protein
MKRVIEHIERAKTKPHHVRKRIAYVGATAGASLIGLIWFVGNLSTGAFAIEQHSFADSVDDTASVVASDTTKTNEAFAGAASAFSNEPEPARIEIVDAPKPSAKRQSEQTTIPF